jgi:HEPN domain-containing protein
MVKSDKDHALQLLEMAGKDLQALANMRSEKDFSEEVFGFHAQQTIEKALKAWIAARSLTYPKSHDVSILIKILEQAGESLTPFPDLEDYTVFAVQYRYEGYDEADELDREDTISKASAFLAHVKTIVENLP